SGSTTSRLRTAPSVTCTRAPARIRIAAGGWTRTRATATRKAARRRDGWLDVPRADVRSVRARGRRRGAGGGAWPPHRLDHDAARRRAHRGHPCVRRRPDPTGRHVRNRGDARGARPGAVLRRCVRAVSGRRHRVDALPGALDQRIRRAGPVPSRRGEMLAGQTDAAPAVVGHHPAVGDVASRQGRRCGRRRGGGAAAGVARPAGRGRFDACCRSTHGSAVRRGGGRVRLALRPQTGGGVPSLTRPATSEIRREVHTMRSAAPEERADAVVVGSGFGGSVSAYRLAEAGLDVVLLERGKAYPPGSFPRNPHQMSRAFWDPTEGLQGLFDVWTFRGFDSIVSSGLGGGSLIYANVMIRKDERWFVCEPLPGGGYEKWPV